jgi:hypothetical protein
MSLHILTLAEAKADLGLTDTTDDAVLTRHMEGLQGRFEAYLGRTLLRGTDVEEILDGGMTWLLLTRFPVESVKTVHVDAAGAWGAETLIAADGYRIHKARGRVVYAGGVYGWPSGSRNVRVVYTGGYVAAGSTPSTGQEAMPEGLRGAFGMQLGFEWRNRRNLGAQNVGAQGQSVTLAPAKFLPAVTDALESFKR